MIFNGVYNFMYKDQRRGIFNDARKTMRVIILLSYNLPIVSSLFSPTAWPGVATECRLLQIPRHPQPCKPLVILVM
jgi:hypothetical protein